MVWEKAHNLVLEIYTTTKQFPAEEKFGLSSQIRRSAVSIPANIVEGFKRRSNKEFARFINISDGSLEETKYHLLLALDLGYISQGQYARLQELCDEIGKMLHGLYKKLSA
ncbi:MAG: four helix bundle protein [Candidatus Aureabacteria bacterium]|nr:four helix bundle protein [Candidatus Auribacterota bacterium]